MGINIINTMTINGVTRSIEEIEWAKNFALKINPPRKASLTQSVTYKKGSLSSTGTGGAHYMCLTTEQKSIEIELDTHCAEGLCFTFLHSDTPAPFVKWGHKKDKWSHQLWFTWDEAAFAVLEVIDSLR